MKILSLPISPEAEASSASGGFSLARAADPRDGRPRGCCAGGRKGDRWEEGREISRAGSADSESDARGPLLQCKTGTRRCVVRQFTYFASLRHVRSRAINANGLPAISPSRASATIVQFSAILTLPKDICSVRVRVRVRARRVCTAAVWVGLVYRACVVSTHAAATAAAAANATLY